MNVVFGFLLFLLQWLARRVLELGGILLAVGSIDPGTLQAIILTVGALMTGQWDQVSLGALIGLIGTVGGLFWNARDTFRPHITDGKTRRVLTEAEARAITGWDGPIEDRSRR